MKEQMNFKDFIKKIFGCREEQIQQELDHANLLIKLYEAWDVKEEELNNKYPKADLTYKRTESDGEYQIDIRDFIQEYDSTLPVIPGNNDDETAINSLKWVIENIKYNPDQNEYSKAEYWAYAYQTLKHKKGDCEDGAILLHNILLKNGVPYWKLRLSAGWVQLGKEKVGHAYLTYYCEESDKWVVLDWCYWPNFELIKDRPAYKDEGKYLEVWFSWNERYCFTQGLNTAAKKMVNLGNRKTSIKRKR